MGNGGSKQLVEGHDGPYVTISNPDGSYELHRCRLDHVGQFRRKWQAINAAQGTESAKA